MAFSLAARTFEALIFTSRRESQFYMKSFLLLLCVGFTFTATLRPGAQPSKNARAGAAPAAKADDIDWTKARQLHQRYQRGDKLTAEELAYYNRARQSRGQATVGASPATSPQRAPEQKPASPSRSYKPLPELGDQRHEGQEGGLYGGGRNVPPDDHANAARRETSQIRPLDMDGKAAEDGKIVLLSLGMSNTTQEFARFKQLADADPLKASRLVIVDGAQGGQDASKTSDPEHQFWFFVEKRLRDAGVSTAQVQVVWLKQAVIAPSQGFSVETPRLQGYLERIVNTAKQRYPNLRIAYLSSRTYGGYATTRLNPEPYAYESAFAVRGLIQEQIKGKASLNYDAAKGDVKAPLLLWGPYLWADGKNPRQADGFFYVREDFVGDGTHPSDSGRRKVAGLLLEFLKADSNARTWFVKPSP
jgi:hypothetical protein